MPLRNQCHPAYPPNRLRQGYGGPPKLHAKAEGGRHVRFDFVKGTPFRACRGLVGRLGACSPYLLIILRLVAAIFIVPSLSLVTSPVNSTLCVMCPTSFAFFSAARSPVT